MFEGRSGRVFYLIYSRVFITKTRFFKIVISLIMEINSMVQKTIILGNIYVGCILCTNTAIIWCVQRTLQIQRYKVLPCFEPCQIN